LNWPETQKSKLKSQKSAANAKVNTNTLLSGAPHRRFWISHFKCWIALQRHFHATSIWNL